VILYKQQQRRLAGNMKSVAQIYEPNPLLLPLLALLLGGCLLLLNLPESSADSLQ